MVQKCELFLWLFPLTMVFNLSIIWYQYYIPKYSFFRAQIIFNSVSCNTFYISTHLTVAILVFTTSFLGFNSSAWNFHVQVCVQIPILTLFFLPYSRILNFSFPNQGLNLYPLQGGAGC